MTASGGYMSTVVGTYLVTLQDLRKLNRTQVAAAADVDSGYLNKIKSGEIKEPSVDKVRKLAHAVGGRWMHVGWLLNHGACDDRGKLLAEAYYRSERGEILTEAQRAVLVELLQDPEVAAAVVAAIDLRRGNTGGS